MNKILLMFAVIGAMEQLAPVSSAPANHDIAVQRTAAQLALNKLNQNIVILESHMVRYIATYLKCIYAVVRYST